MSNTNGMWITVNGLDDDVQFQLLASGLDTPVSTKGLSSVIDGFPEQPKCATARVAYLGDDTIKNVWKATGGNPLANEDREKMCLLITPVVLGFNYEETFHGVVNEGDQAYLRRIPSYFQRNVRQTMEFAKEGLAELTEQQYTVLAAKLNPLASGKANIVMYIKFHSYCEFDRQMYYTPTAARIRPGMMMPRIRIVPKPIITKFGDTEKGYKLNVEFVTSVKETVFSDMYNILQNLVEKELGLHMRHIKTCNDGKELSVVTQITDKTNIADIDTKVKAWEKKYKNSFLPHIMDRVSIQQVDV